VVPYNRAALLKFECHINVELVSTAWVIKYVVRARYRCHAAAPRALTPLQRPPL